jgi:hypothetical protein
MSLIISNFGTFHIVYRCIKFRLLLIGSIINKGNGYIWIESINVSSNLKRCLYLFRNIFFREHIVGDRGRIKVGTWLVYGL